MATTQFPFEVNEIVIKALKPKFNASELTDFLNRYAYYMPSITQNPAKRIRIMQHKYEQLIAKESTNVVNLESVADKFGASGVLLARQVPGSLRYQIFCPQGLIPGLTTTEALKAGAGLDDKLVNVVKQLYFTSDNIGNLNDLATAHQLQGNYRVANEDYPMNIKLKEILPPADVQQQVNVILNKENIHYYVSRHIESGYSLVEFDDNNWRATQRISYDQQVAKNNYNSTGLPKYIPHASKRDDIDDYLILSDPVNQSSITNKLLCSGVNLQHTQPLSVLQTFHPSNSIQYTGTVFEVEFDSKDGSIQVFHNNESTGLGAEQQITDADLYNAILLAICFPLQEVGYRYPRCKNSKKVVLKIKRIAGKIELAFDNDQMKKKQTDYMENLAKLFTQIQWGRTEYNMMKRHQVQDQQSKISQVQVGDGKILRILRRIRHDGRILTGVVLASHIARKIIKMLENSTEFLSPEYSSDQLVQGFTVLVYPEFKSFRLESSQRGQSADGVLVLVVDFIKDPLVLNPVSQGRILISDTE